MLLLYNKTIVQINDFLLSGNIEAGWEIVKTELVWEDVKAERFVIFFYKCLLFSHPFYILFFLLKKEIIFYRVMFCGIHLKFECKISLN